MSLENLVIDKLIVHKIGNKMRDEGYKVSQTLHDLNDSNIKELLQKYFLRPFKQKKHYHFFHESKLELNEIYHYANDIFRDNNSFYENSVLILKHLYGKSNHPQIKSGELYISYFKNYSEDEQNIDVIGIFKSEDKDTFLKINESNQNFNILYDKGININKLDKGCLIFNVDSEIGYKVLIVDSGASSQENEAQYWKNNFLNIKEFKNEVFNTKSFIQICNAYSNTNHNPPLEFEQIVDFKKSTYNYFEENELYQEQDYLNTVFNNQQNKEEFEKFKLEYENNNGFQTDSNFEISKPTLTLLKKKFITAIKLDTGTEMKITNTEYLEKGYDQEKGMKYYKLYYFNEI